MEDKTSIECPQGRKAMQKHNPRKTQKRKKKEDDNKQETKSKRRPDVLEKIWCPFYIATLLFSQSRSNLLAVSLSLGGA